MKRQLDNFSDVIKFYFEYLKAIDLELVGYELFKRLGYMKLADADFDGHLSNVRHAEKFVISWIFNSSFCASTELGAAIYKPKEAVSVH